MAVFPRIRRLAAGLCCLGVLIITGPALAAVGSRMITLAADDFAPSADLTLFYPAPDERSPLPVADHGIFRAPAARPDAPLAPGRFPLIVLSFGGLRAAPGLGDWLAAGLAARGQVVAVLEPPPPARIVPALLAAEPWRRAERLSAALNRLARDPLLSPHLRPGAVGVVGVFLGGTAALTLAGGRLDGPAYRQRCDQPAADRDCRWLAEHHVDLHDVDAAVIAADRRDRRIAAVVAVAPEMAADFTAASLAAVPVPVTVIDLGATGGDLPAPLRRVVVPAASPWAVLPPCRDEGAALLRREGEDPALCAEDPAYPRSAVHRALIEAILHGLALGLAPS